MVRGRKKDLTIPPSRSLLQQRDYRARKAQYIQELQERCARVEQENVRLRRELEIARAAVPLNVPSPEVMLASNDLMRHLAVVSASISRFQQAVEQSSTFSPPSSSDDGMTSHPYSLTHTARSSASRSSSLRPAVFPSPSASSSSHPTLPAIDPTLFQPEKHGPPPSQGLPQSLKRLMDSQPHGRPASPISSARTSPTPSLGPECCGGYVDCTELVDEEECEGCTGACLTGSQQQSQELPSNRRTPA